MTELLIFLGYLAGTTLLATVLTYGIVMVILMAVIAKERRNEERKWKRR